MAFLQVNNLHKNFGKTQVLKGVSFALEEGEVLSVIGSSGNGKTTLLRCLNFLERADLGTITLNGEVIYDGEQKLTEGQIAESRRHLGMVFQNFNLFPQYTACENITLPLTLMEKDRKLKGLPSLLTTDSPKEEALMLLARVGLQEKANNYPCELSGGQQQRVAIARAMALKPDILCFDEPTSALDPELTGEVLKVIKELKDREHITMIIVTHEMGFAENVSDKVLFLADGSVEEMGDAKQVFNQPKSEKLQNFLNNSYHN